MICENSFILIKCKICKRKFKSESLPKHENVCEKVFKYSRPKINSQRKRIINPEHVVILKDIHELRRKGKLSDKPKNE